MGPRQAAPHTARPPAPPRRYLLRARGRSPQHHRPCAPPSSGAGRSDPWPGEDEDGDGAAAAPNGPRCRPCAAPRRAALPLPAGAAAKGLRFPSSQPRREGGYGQLHQGGPGERGPLPLGPGCAGAAAYSEGTRRRRPGGTLAAAMAWRAAVRERAGAGTKGQ